MREATMAFLKTIKTIVFCLIVMIILINCAPRVVEGQQAVIEKPAVIPVTATSGTTGTHPDAVTPATEPSRAADQAAQAAALEPTLFIPQISNASVTTPPPPPGGGGTTGGPFIADNASVDQFASIPQSAISAARAKKLLFYHQSTGGYIDQDGLECIAGNRGGWDGFPAECATYAQNPAQYARTNWDTPFWPTPLADAPAKMDQFLSLMTPRVFSTYDVIGMKFCYVDGWNQDFENYRSHMEALEAAHPNKTFIWATSALWHDPGTSCDPSNPFNSCAAIADFNTQVRAYAKAHNKPLYDIASIESNGGTCTVAGYEGMCAEYYADSGGHPTKPGSLRLAKGLWWLMARIGGWQP
jgi:hypothetical protein